MSFKTKLIECTINDSSDYDYIYDNAVHNTLRKYFKWSEISDVNVNFTKSYDEQGYGLLVVVHAEFQSKEDYALFKLNFDPEPLNKLVINNLESYFEHN